MIPFLERFLSHVTDTPEKTAIVDQGGERKTSYGELDSISGSIASWLKKQGIGKEDIVAICVPRGLEFVAVRLAVMKAGAAWVGTEAMMGSERISYIIKDSNAAFVMDERKYEEAVKEEPLAPDEWADPDPHDLAFIYYTSGSTGLPKGVAQEYGVYRYIMSSTDRAIGRWIPLDYANVAPETFIGGLYLMMGVLQAGSTLHLIPLTLVRDPIGLLDYFKKQNVTASCMPPTLVKALESAGGIDVKVLHITGEIATDLYIDRFPVLNAYGPTEFSYLPFFFDIDRPYSNTPIGTPDEYTKAVLIDKNNRVNDTEGMLCIQLPFFRGYLHESDRTELISINGETYYKSGDYMSVDDKGNYTLLGRVDDMLNINGNRIEPFEVETALRKVLNVRFAAVKQCFRGGISFLAAYIPKESIPVPENIRESLMAYLPEFMLPSCYIGIDKLPINENGKTVRKDLPNPSEEALFADYAAPRSDIEKTLCTAFAEVLNISPEKVGIDDNFFLLGGDSLSAMRLIIKANLKCLDFRLVYREKNVRGIAAALMEDSLEDAETESFPPEGLPLTDEELWFLNRQLELPDRMVCNQPIKISLKADVDIEKLKKAILSAVDAHPVLRTTIKRKDNEWRQYYDPEILKCIEVVTPPEEVNKDYFMGFPVIAAFDGSPLNYITIFRLKDRVLLLMDLCHVICDGTSFRIIVEDIMTLYMGGSIPKNDGFMHFCKKRLDLRQDDDWKDKLDYFKERYRNLHGMLPEYDMSGDNPGLGEYERSFKFPFDEVLRAAGALNITSNTFFLLVSAVTLMAVNKRNDCLLTWTWNGRSDTGSLRTAGLLTMDLPVELRVNKNTKISELAFETAEQFNSGITNGSVSPFMKKNSPGIPCFIYEGDMWKNPANDIITDIDILFSDRWAALEPLEISIWEDEEGSRLELSYDSSLYSEEKMAYFADTYIAVCEELLKEDSGNIRVEDLIGKCRLH